MTYKASDRCVAKLCELEGFSPKPYQDTGGKWTRGYGELCKKDSAPVTEVEAHVFVLMRLEQICKGLERLLPGLTGFQVDALCLFLYNIGVPAFEESGTYQMLAQRDWMGLLRWEQWVHDSKHKAQPGLISRRKFETSLFCFGWKP